MQGSRVLLVDDDVEALATLAAALRLRGVRVSLANGLRMACERARAGAYDLVLASRAVAESTEQGMGLFDLLSVDLVSVPPLLLLCDSDDADTASTGLANEKRIARDDIEGILRHITPVGLPPVGIPTVSSLAVSEHALENAALAELFLVLSEELRSGTLTVTTPKGSGEIRWVNGDIFDAVYIRLEGRKALVRMLGERVGSATFAPGAPAIMRRLHGSTPTLLAEARALVERTRDLYGIAEPLLANMLMAVEGLATDVLSEVEQHVLSRLRVPSMVDDLLDELPHMDAAIVESLLRLDGLGRIKHLGLASLRVQLCGPDQMHLLRASAARAKSPGFSGAARLVFAATPARLAVFGHTVLSLADTFSGPDGAPPVPVPYVVATIRLGDGVELDIVALPLVPVYAPLWPLALAGATLLVRLDEAASQALEEACASVGLAILDARAVFGALEESSAVQVASLVRTALDAEGSGLA